LSFFLISAIGFAGSYLSDRHRCSSCMLTPSMIIAREPQMPFATRAAKSQRRIDLVPDLDQRIQNPRLARAHGDVVKGPGAGQLSATARTASLCETTALTVPSSRAVVGQHASIRLQARLSSRLPLADSVQCRSGAATVCPWPSAGFRRDIEGASVTRCRGSSSPAALEERLEAH
jgi:hypothetical protein